MGIRDKETQERYIEVQPSTGGFLCRAYAGPVVLDFTDDGVARYDIVLETGGILEGTFQARNGTPIENFCISIEVPIPERIPVRRPHRRSTLTDEGGRFRFVGLPEGLYRVGPALVSRSFRGQKDGKQYEVRPGEITTVKLIAD